MAGLSREQLAARAVYEKAWARKEETQQARDERRAADEAAAQAEQDRLAAEQAKIAEEQRKVEEARLAAERERQRLERDAAEAERAAHDARTAMLRADFEATPAVKSLAARARKARQEAPDPNDLVGRAVHRAMEVLGVAFSPEQWWLESPNIASTTLLGERLVASIDEYNDTALVLQVRRKVHGHEQEVGSARLDSMVDLGELLAKHPGLFDEGDQFHDASQTGAWGGPEWGSTYGGYAGGIDVGLVFNEPAVT